MDRQRQVSRRSLLKLAGAGALGTGATLALAACGETQIVEVPVDRVVTQIVEKVVTQEVPITKVVEKIVTQQVAVEVQKEVPVEVQKIVTVEVAPQRPPVTLVAWYNQIEYTKPAWDKIAADYKAQNPHATLKVNGVPHPDAVTKYLTALAGGESMDIVYVHPQTNSVLAARGAVQPLDDFWNNDSEFPLGDFYEGLLLQHQYLDGKFYAIPMQHAPILLIYNRDALEELGIGDLWEMDKEGKWTIDVHTDILERGVAGEGENQTWGGREIPAALKIYYLWVWGFDGGVWNEDATATLLNEAGSVEAFEYITRLITDELVPSRDFSRAFPGGAEGMFLSGNLRTYWGAKWTTTKVPDDINAGIVPPYKMPNGTNTNRDATNAYGIHGASENPEEAWDLLKYMTTEGVVEMYKVGFTAPTRKSHEDLAVWLNSLAPWEDPAVHRAAVERYDRVFYHPVRYDEINNDFVLPAVDGVILGEETVQEAMDRIKPGIDELLNEPL